MRHSSLTKIKPFAIASAIALFSVQVLAADPSGYAFVTVDPPDGLEPGAIAAPGVGHINDRGWLVGAYQKPNTPIGISQAYLDTGQAFTNINVPGAPGGTWAANGINNRGTITGIFNARFGGITETRGFINRDGQFTALDVPGLRVVHADGISNDSTIVGWAGTCGNCQRHGFVRSPQGQITRLDIALAFDTFLTGVNNAGVVVGYYNLGFSGPVTGFLRRPYGAVSPIQVPGALQTFVKAINDAGEVVGYYQTATTMHGFVLDTNGFVTVDVPGASSTQVTGINNHGVLAGRFDDDKGAHAFVALLQ